MTEPVREEGESLADFARRRAEHFGFKTAPKIEPSPESVEMHWDDDLVPDVELTKKSAEQIEMDAVLNGIDVVEAYNRWCGKMFADPGTKRKNVMISCPIPGHADKVPSASIDLDIGDGGVWMCHRCDQGGDKYDIAAWHFGFDVPGYKSKDDFPELRRRMAEDLGYTVMTSGKDEWLEIRAEPTSTTPEVIEDTPIAPAPRATITEIGPQTWFDWRRLHLRDHTFLKTWLEVTSTSYEPEEFYLFHGFTALAAAVGNSALLEDAVRPNLMTCVVGPTGAGKSLSIGYLEDLIRAAIPFNRDLGSGVRLPGSAGSGESLIDLFNFKVSDPTTDEVTWIPINAILKEDEMASLMKRVGRHGNTSREVLMGMFDRSTPISTNSRGHGEVTAENHFMQLVTSTQHESVRRLLTDEDAAAGFLNRWVYVYGNLKVRPPRGVEKLDVSPAVESLQKVRAWASGGVNVQWFDDEAGEEFDKFYFDEIHPLTLKSESWMHARLPHLAKKLLLLFAVNDRSTSVLLDHVENLKMLWPYLLSCYAVVAQEVGNSDFELAMESIEEYMRENQEQTFSIRDIYRNTHCRRLGGKELAVRAVELLIRAGIVREVPKERGSKSLRYEYIPEVEQEGATIHVLRPEA